MTHRIRLSLDVGTYGPIATAQSLLELAALAESADFDSVWLADHVVFPKTYASRYPYSADGAFPTPGEDPVFEPVATMGVLIGATRRVRIGTAVLVMPYRNPVVLGKMFATYDQFSSGRVMLGAGVGWLEEEFRALDARDFANRGAVTDEYVEVFKRVAGGCEVSFDGAQYQLAPVFAVPGSVQRPHPPVLIGGTTSRALERVARHGDGWISVALSPRALAPKLARLAEYCAQAGRDLASLRLCHKLFISLGEARIGMDGEREPGTGSAVQIRDDLVQLADLGYEEVIVRYRGDSTEEQVRQLSEFVDQVATGL